MQEVCLLVQFKFYSAFILFPLAVFSGLNLTSDLNSELEFRKPEDYSIYNENMSNDILLSYKNIYKLEHNRKSIKTYRRTKSAKRTNTTICACMFNHIPFHIKKF